MNIISSILIVFAILFSILTSFGLITTLRYGGVNVIFPGLGLVVSLSALIVAFLIIQIILITVAAVIRTSPENSKTLNNNPRISVNKEL